MLPHILIQQKKLLCDHLLLVQNIVMLQASSAGSPSPATATVAKYLLKLWIQQRLEQVSGTWHDESRVTCHVSDSQQPDLSWRVPGTRGHVPEQVRVGPWQQQPPLLPVGRVPGYKTLTQSIIIRAVNVPSRSLTVPLLGPSLSPMLSKTFQS